MLASDFPFQEYKVYGPTFHKTEGRFMVFLVKSQQERTSMAYARYLLCVDQKRWLGPHENVDHIDNDRTNDDLNNLQILSRTQNSQKHHANIGTTTTTAVQLLCPVCGAEFTRRRGQTHLIKGGSPTCCSRICGRESAARKLRKS